jgi:chaperonin GroEL
MGLNAWLQSNTTETAVVEKPAEEDEDAGHHHGHAH